MGHPMTESDSAEVMTSLAIIWNVERVMGIEPTYAAWEAAVLPLNYTRVSGLYYMHFAGERNHRLRIFCHKSSCSANY